MPYCGSTPKRKGDERDLGMVSGSANSAPDPTQTQAMISLSRVSVAAVVFEPPVRTDVRFRGPHEVIGAAIDNVAIGFDLHPEKNTSHMPSYKHLFAPRSMRLPESPFKWWETRPNRSIVNKLVSSSFRQALRSWGVIGTTYLWDLGEG